MSKARKPQSLASRRAAVAAALPGGLPAAGIRIGLLGGSFNPAHEGHLEISREALRRLRLQEVWWLVSPQNPLKSASGMAPAEERLDSARRMARDTAIRPALVESALGSVYTADTLTRLLQTLPKMRFVWLMGADNLIQIDRWARWQQIFNTVPVAIFDRPSYSLRALSSKAALMFRQARIDERDAGELADLRPPAWVFIHNRLNTQSATQIRAKQET